MSQPGSLAELQALDAQADGLRTTGPEVLAASSRPGQPVAPGLAPGVRRDDLDWLRMAAILMLIPYHAARVFDSYEPFYVKSSQTSMGLTILRTVVDPWGMPLLFVIAGAGAFFALQRRGGRQYLGERVLRLVVVRDHPN